MATVADVSEAREGLFTRKSTGLVRSVSPFSVLLFNSLTAPAPFILAIALFWTLGAFPGANLYLALALGYGVGILFSVAVGLISSAMPRSGGDYVLVGRILHPVAGLVSSFCFTAGVLLSVAFLTLALVTSAIGPCLIVVGLIADSSWLTEAGNTVQSSHWWQYGLGMGGVLLAGLICASGWRWSLRFQNVGYVFMTLGLVLTAIVLLFNGGDDFIASFNSFAEPTTHDPDTYRSLIAEAHKQGINLDPGSDFSNTWGALGAVMGFSVYTWFSVHIAGEVRQAGSWKVTGAMAGAAILNCVAVIVMTALFFHAFGTQFFAAANALSGTDAYPFEAPPFYVFLTSIASGSTIIAVLLGLSFFLTVLLVLWINIIQPVRALFAYAFDGLLPLKVASVNPRSRAPLVALGITVVIVAGLYAWAVWGASFFEVYANAVIITVVALILLGIAAMVMPYRRPELWRGSLTTRRVLGIPLTTLAGVVATAVALLNGYLFLHYPALGLTSRWDAVRNAGLVCLGALVVYGIASAVRSRQGVSLGQASSEIPPE
jgi:amino acid transporter